MAIQINGAIVKGEFRGFYEVKGKDSKVYMYGQLLQTDGSGRESMIEFKARDENIFNNMTKGAIVEVPLNIKEMDWQGKKFVVVEAS